jgi:hypothetical protein
MKYVDAGYIIALSVLFVYALSLIARGRRGERALLVAERAEPETAAAKSAIGEETGSEDVKKMGRR